MGIEEVREEVDRNFIRVMIGGEPYLLGGAQNSGTWIRLKF